jgi:group I intron endonuclease
MDTYIAINTVNGCFYIGSAVNFERRKREHLKSKANLPFQNALRKNPDEFEWEVWSDDSTERILEQALLDMWCGKSQCYNISNSSDCPGSEGGRKGGKIGGKRVHELHPEHVQKLIEDNKTNRPDMQSENGKKTKEKGVGIFGIPADEKSRISTKAALKVHELYPTMARNIGLRAKEEKFGIFGWTEEERREHNIRASVKGLEKRLEVVCKAVICVETGLVYHSAAEASRQTGINRSSISKCCRNEQKIASKFHWQFYNSEKNV